MDLGKIPPHDEKLEISLLGAIMLDNNVLRDISIFLKKESFYKEVNGIIYGVMIDLYHKDKPIDMLIVSDELKKINKLDECGGYMYISNIATATVVSHNALFHAQIIYQKYINREMISICHNIIKKCYEEQEDIDDIIEEGTEKISSMLSMKKRKDMIDFNTALDSAANEIDNNIVATSSIFRTGYAKFDELYALKKNTIFLIAGDKGSAKSNFVASLCKGLITLNNNVYLLWFTMEDPKEKIIRRFMSSECGLSDRKLLSIGCKITGEEQIMIGEAYQKVSSYSNNISFVDQKVDLMQLKKMIRKSNEIAKSRDKELIVIIDNLGLIDHPGIKDELTRENYVAGELVNIRSETHACILLVHHLSKAQLFKANVKDGYRPREEYIRGSSRIVDYCNQSALVNLPSKYPDLMETYRKTTIDMPDEIPINDSTIFAQTFMSINPNPDYHTNKIGIKDLRQSSFNKFVDIIMQESNFDDGTPMNAIELYKRWINYVTLMDSINADRDAKWKKEVCALYTFFDKKMYNYKERENKDSREYYLFNGTGISNDKKYDVLSKLFIIEANKIRDYSPKGDAILRYEANLNSNIFNEI